MGLGAQAEDWDKDSEHKQVMGEVSRYLRPEFINRLDEVIIFNRLDRDELRQILDIQVKSLETRLAGLGKTLEFTNAAKASILESIESLSFGARPLRRKLETMVENEVASLLISQEAAGRKHFVVDLIDGQIKVDLRLDR